MKRCFTYFSMVAAVLVLAAFFTSVVCMADSDKKAKEILSKTYDKYTDIIKKGGDEVKSLAAKITIKGSGQVPMGSSGGVMPMNVNATLELYFAKPRNVYVGLTGNLGNATIVVSGDPQMVATIMLPGTKQFAKIDVPEETTSGMDETAEKPPSAEEALKDVNLSYEGTADTKLGKAHKIGIRPDNSEEGGVTLYILDGKWDPARVDINVEGKAKVTVEFEKLELNKNISDKRFVPDTAGLTEISKDQLGTVIMMQVMGAMMQGGGGAPE